VALLAGGLGISTPANASWSMLCKAKEKAPVYTMESSYSYTIQPGRYMRVVDWFYNPFGTGTKYFVGHGNGHSQDGYSIASHFSTCIPG